MRSKKSLLFYLLIVSIFAGCSELSIQAKDNSSGNDATTGADTKVTSVRIIGFANPYTMDNGSSIDLDVEVLPESATNKAVTYSTVNTNIVSLNATSGIVNAIGDGESTIVVTTSDGGKTDSIKIVVVTQPTVNPDEQLLLEMDSKYPSFPIQLSPFTLHEPSVTREISIEEKRHMLKAFDLMRFVVNTPEFKQEVRLKELDGSFTYRFEAENTINGTQHSINKGEYYDREIILAIIDNANITSYVRKGEIDDNALGTLGPVFYGDIDLNNPVIEGDNVTDDFSGISRKLMIMFDNIDWTDTGLLYGDIYDLSTIVFHELMHNLGFGHLNNSPNEIWNQSDTVNTLDDIYYEVVTNNAWRSKYRTEIENYNYYQLKYKDYLLSPTVD